jgi:CO/xanthine dehydrogenase Mo-binding subunit
MNGLGAPLPRIDGPGKVAGTTQFPADRIPADALWAVAVFSDQPHARLVALETADALAAPGVVSVLVAADVPVNEYGLTMFDQPVLVGTSQSPRVAVDTTVSRWEADHIAVVIADSHLHARAAADRLAATWAPLPLVADVDAALAAGAPLVHDEAGTNAYVAMRIRKGDMAAGWAAADVVVEGTYQLPYQEHAYLQPEAGIAYVDGDGRVTVEIAGQWTHEDREQIAHALDLRLDQVRVRYPAIGGAFGGREDMSLQIVLALAARDVARRGLDRVVAMQWSREESIVGHAKRHRGRITCRWGARADGLLTAVDADIVLDAGAYNYTSNKVLGNCHLAVAGAYQVANARIDAAAVYTNTVPGGAFRGFGAPQGTFAAEAQMNKLADRLGLDPLEIRRRNALREGSIGITDTELPPGVTLPQVIDACAAQAAHAAPVHPFSPFATLAPRPDRVRHGRGFAVAGKNIGFSFGFPERCEATIVLHGDVDAEEIQRVELFHAGADVGQGAHTAFVQMAAEAVGTPVDHVAATFSDTATTGDSGSASASRLTWMGGNAILGAAEEAEKAWRRGTRPAVGHFRYVPPPTEALDPDTGRGVPNFAYGWVAQCVELSVDIDTGHIVVRRVVSAHDVGKAINRDLVIGQIEGAIAQAHGYALTEDLRVLEGRIVNPRLSAYLIPGILDVPEQITSVILELPDPRGPWGAKGVAEMPLIPYAAAVAGALHDATGVWFDAIPLTPDRVLARLAEAGVS